MDLVARLRRVGSEDVLESASVAETRIRTRGRLPRDLYVVSMALPDGSGIGLVAELHQAGWTHGLLLCPDDDPYAVRAALGMGVRAYLVIPREPGSLGGGQPGSLGGGQPGSLGGADPGRAPRARGSLAAGPAGLSAREVEVLERVAEGASNKQIGQALGLSALTVKSHLARIGRKLGTGDRAEMVALAMRAGLVA
ncbi:MAG: helix-turn-helix transcriptional regulator [Actinomycetes bacterium]